MSVKDIKKELLKYINKKIEESEIKILKKYQGGTSNTCDRRKRCNESMDGVIEQKYEKCRRSTRRKVGDWLVMDIEEMLPIHIDLDKEYNEDWSLKTGQETISTIELPLMYSFAGVYPNIASLVSLINGTNEVQNNVQEFKQIDQAKTIIRNLKTKNYILNKNSNGLITYILQKNPEEEIFFKEAANGVTDETKATKAANGVTDETKATEATAAANGTTEATAAAKKEKANNMYNESINELNNNLEILKNLIVIGNNINLVELIERLELCLKYANSTMKKGKIIKKYSETLQNAVIVLDENDELDVEYEKQYMSGDEYNLFINKISELTLTAAS